MQETVALALHGGAGASHALDYTRHRAHMLGVVEAARDRLRTGAGAVEVAEHVVLLMEDSGLYVAGRGASPNLAGEYELDASIMDGRTRRAGAVAGLTGFRNPIAVARLVMRETAHVLLAGAGAERFAEEMGAMPTPEGEWFTHAGEGESNHAPAFLAKSTVGCVVRDARGNLAAATSSAGVFGKVPGRVGDCPLIGSGTWADERVAVSCTGQGELFIQAAAAAQLAFAVRGGAPLAEASERTLDDVLRQGGEGGVVSIDVAGNVVMPFRAEGMKRAALLANGDMMAAVFDD